ncbi:hypothetical protein JMJ56_28230 [Belnapia sp. T18]|uniref:N-acetyltransferase domain-containing protein n=2 Tax=Belnapia arida TaxID=2804533 RepID=A0ABS1UDX4_9PROT|nr:hypothetical protein [Belnapia arida]
MRFVEEEVGRRGFHEVRLTTAVVIRRNIDLYQRLGYAITGREPTATVDRVWITKRVNAASET